MTKQERSGNFRAVMMMLNLLLFLFFTWLLYNRLSMHFGVSSVGIIPQAQPVAITRPVMPKPTTLPSALEVPKSTLTLPSPEGRGTREAGGEGEATEAKEATKATTVKSSSPPAPQAQAPRQKTRRIDFEYSNPEAKSVSIDGSFLNWKPRPMKRNGNSWRINLYIFPGKYRYHFVVDGEKTLDPLQPLKRNGESYLIVVP